MAKAAHYPHIVRNPDLESQHVMIKITKKNYSITTCVIAELS